MNIKKFVALLFCFALLLNIISKNCQAYENIIMSNSKTRYLSIFLNSGLITHFNTTYNEYFDSRFFKSLGGGFSYQLLNKLSLNFETNYSSHANNWNKTEPISNNRKIHKINTAEFHCYSYLISANFFLFDNKDYSNVQNSKLNPYLGIGFSQNQYSMHIKYEIEIIDNTNNSVIEYINNIVIPKTNDKSLQSGLLLTPGIYITFSKKLNVVLEMQYHTINARYYHGGLTIRIGGNIFLF